MKQQVLVFSLGALAAFGAAGWLRSWLPVNVATTQFQAPEQVIAEPAALGDPEFEALPVWRDEAAPQAIGRTARPVVRRAVPVSASEAAEPRLKQRAPQPAVDRSDTSEPQLRTPDAERARQAEQPRVEAEADPVVYPSEPAVRERSKKASIAIVAGSSAAGAAIGAAAGGGKGAAIGAIAGGAGGYVYDRMTHKKRETPTTQGATVRSDTAGYRDSGPDYGNPSDHTTMDTLKNVGIGAAGGAALGGLAGGGKGAAIGAVAGGAGGYVYDRIKRR
jgi:hypothetical protein